MVEVQLRFHLLSDIVDAQTSKHPCGGAISSNIYVTGESLLHSPSPSSPPALTPFSWTGCCLGD